MHATDFSFARQMPGLPDPDLDPQFYAGVPRRRLAAWLIDFTVILLIGVPLATMFGILTLGFGFLVFPFLLAAVDFLYRVATVSSGSATWGMRIMGIELRRADGSRFEFTTALMHTTLYTISFAFLISQVISCLAMIGTRYGQGLPDIVLRTTAINRPAD